MKNKYLQLVIASIILFLFNCSLVVAQAPSNAPGIDLILLIDQSGSMSDGIGGQKNPTDPKGFRIAMAQSLVDYLYFDNKYINKERINRIVMVEFGTDAAVMIPLTPLNGDDNSIAAIKSRISSKVLGETNFLRAFEVAHQQLSPEAGRQAIIILVTDGTPYIEARKEVSTATLFGEIEEFYKTNFGSEKYPLYVVAIDTTPNHTIWKQGLGETYWGRIATPEHAKLVTNTFDVNKEVISFLCPFLSKSGTAKECQLQQIGPHFIKPYAESLSLGFFKYTPDSIVTITDSDGIEIVNNDPNVIYKASPPLHPINENYVIQNPKSGCWETARTGEGDVDVAIDLAFNDLQLINDTVSQILPFTVPLRIVNEAGKMVENDPKYPINFSVSLINSTKSLSPLNSSLVSTKDGYSTDTPLPLPNSGNYQIEVKGTIDVSEDVAKNCFPDLDKKPSDPKNYPIFTKTFPFTVTTTELKLESPASPHWQYEAVSGFTFRFLNQKTPLLLPQEIPWHFELLIKSPNGIAQSYPAIFDNKNGVVKVNQALWLNETGSYSLTLIAKDENEHAFYEGQTTLETTQQINFLHPAAIYPVKAPLPLIELQLLQNDKPLHPTNLELEAVLTRSDSEPEVIPLSWLTTTETYQGMVNGGPLMTPDNYPLELTGRETSTQQVAFTTRLTLQAKQDLPYFEVITPQPNAIYDLHSWFSYLPMPIEVQVKAGEEAVPISEFFKTPANDLVELKIWNSVGITVTEQKLTFNDSEPDRLRFNPELDAGSYTATLRLSGKLSDASADYQDLLPPQTITFQREETLFMKIVWGIIYLLVIITFIAILVWLVMLWRNTRPPFPLGNFSIEAIGSADRPLFELNLSSISHKRRIVQIPGKQIPADLQLSKITIACGSAAGSLKNIQVKLYHPKKKSISDKNLLSNMPQSVDEPDAHGNRYQIRYNADN